MGKKKKEIKIIKKDSKKGDYTFVSNNILKNTIMNLQIMKLSLGLNQMIELKKRFTQRKEITKEERF